MKITGMWAVHEFMNSIPYLNMVVSTVLNFVPGCQVWCAALHNGMSTFVATGSLTAGIKVGVISAAAGYALQGIGEQFSTASDLNIAAIADAGNAAAEQAMIDSMVSFGGNLLTSGQVVAQIGAHAMVGGISAELMGGKFGHGFISAGVTKGAGGAFLPGGANLKTREIVRGTIISAAIGGTASALSGGKFVNGARMAAMQYLLNQTGESAKRNAQRKRIMVKLLQKNRQGAVYEAGKYLGITEEHMIEHEFKYVNKTFYGDTSQTGKVRIGADAFKSIEALISTVGHENIHTIQYQEGKLGYPGTSLYYQNQIEAHQWEINNVDLTGFTRGIQENLNFIEYYNDQLNK